MTYTHYKARILATLSDGAWHCGMEFVRDYMLSYSQRVSQVNALDPRNPRILSRVCRDHEHRGTIHTYRDTQAAKPQQMRLVG